MDIHSILLKIARRVSAETGVVLMSMLRKAPRRVRGLQRDLRHAGFPDLVETVYFAPETSSAISALKACERLLGKGITLQVLDRLDAADAALRSEKR